MAAERGVDLVYLTGEAWGTQWGFFPAGRQSGSRVGWLLGFRWNASASTFQPIGYRPYFGVGARDSVGVLGMAYDSSRAQFYLLGEAIDSLFRGPLWPTGAQDTVRLSPNVSDPYRLWLGRLDWYRVDIDNPSLSACIPDTLVGPFSARLTGSEPASWSGRYEWLPKTVEARYFPFQQVAQRVALHWSTNTATEGRRTVVFPHLVVSGRFGAGRYFLTRQLPTLPSQWADVIDTLWLHPTGTTIPHLGRFGAFANARAVVRYLGSVTAFTPAHLAPIPFYRKDLFRFGLIRGIDYAPWEGGKEKIHLLEEEGGQKYWYQIDLREGGLASRQLVPSTYKGLFWDPVRGRVLFLGPNNLYEPNGGGLLWTPSVQVQLTRGAYPLRCDSLWVHELVTAIISPVEGDVLFIGTTYPFTGSNVGLWRVSFVSDSAWRVAGGGSGCAQDGVGGGVVIAASQLSTLAAERDTLYWIELSSGCLPSPTRWLLRKAFPVGGNTRSYQVQTIDTFPVGPYVPGPLRFEPLPHRALLFWVPVGPEWKLVRYRLPIRQVDTLIGCGGTDCCLYGLSDFVRVSGGQAPSFAALRGGSYVFGGEGELRIALPSYAVNDQDTLLAEGPLSSAGLTSWGGGHLADTLHLTPPYSGVAGEDSTRIAPVAAGCGRSHSLYYGAYRFPVSSVSIIAPDSVCLGSVFHSHVEFASDHFIEGCRILSPFREVLSKHGYLYELNASPWAKRWRARASGHDTLQILQANRWRWLFPSTGGVKPIRILQGHRIRFQVALEGSRIIGPTSQFLRPHHFLTRRLFAQYSEGMSGVSSDSLWRLPRPREDSLVQNWEAALTVPLLGPCPGAGEWFCDAIWTSVARVEVYEGAQPLPVEILYVLIDTAGRLYPYRAPLGPIGFSSGMGDTLHFCRCDLTASKYFVIRTPHHLPLYTQAFSLPVRDIGQADSYDLTDPTYLRGIPGVHYTLIPDSTLPSLRMRAAAWAGNCADVQNGFVPGPHHDAGVINAADLEFFLRRNGVTSGFSWADLNADGVVDSEDAILFLLNQNALRRSVGP
ncbi:MAG: hypothetical protein N2170_09830 [Bacteroidia bacterium]|nr:hypothetical protein [Bacteroidia bacterium]